MKAEQRRVDKGLHAVAYAASKAQQCRVDTEWHVVAYASSRERR
jgi:hypothetical protein